MVGKKESGKIKMYNSQSKPVINTYRKITLVFAISIILKVKITLSFSE